MELENVNPTLYEKVCERATSANEMDDNEFDPIDSREVFGRFAKSSWLNLLWFQIDFYKKKLTLKYLTDLIRNLNDPEHPLTLEQLNVLDQESVKVRFSGSVTSWVSAVFVWVRF